MRLAPLFAIAAVALGACTSTGMAGGAPNAASDSRDCFLSYRVNNFDPVDDTHVRITVSPSRRYILTTQSSMRTADWTQPLVLDAPNQVCVGDVQGVKLIGGEPRRQFFVTRVDRAPPDTAVEGS
jgi:hypothetical protein